jgi:hypothetical protein
VPEAAAEEEDGTTTGEVAVGEVILVDAVVGATVAEGVVEVAGALAGAGEADRPWGVKIRRSKQAKRAWSDRRDIAIVTHNKRATGR